MLKANDLRIGNYVKGIAMGLTHKIDLHFFNECYDDDTMLDWYMPIKLTSEILDKCGFKVEGTYNSAKRWISESQIILFEGNGYFTLCQYSATQIKYLHQLQNLYYSLVGSELNVVW